jgi:alkylation response protein AidB-like acyl-CoA dehydrogenase
MIDFTFTEEQQMVRKTAREFAETHVAPRIAEMEEKYEMSKALLGAMGEARLMALTIPKEYGGLGLGYVARLIVLEEIARVSGAAAMALQIFGLGIEPILRFGSDAQKEKYLRSLAEGQRLATVAVTETTGGSNPRGIRTAYRRQGDHYVLNGRKCFITNSHVADTVVVLARSEEEPDTFSTFIVEQGMEGFRPGHEEHKVGLRGCNMGELVFEDCRVPAENLLGPEGKGMRIVLSAIGEVGRGGIVGCALGLHVASLEASVRFAKERVLYGKPIAELPTIQSKLAEMKIELEAARLLGYRAAALQDQGRPADREFAAAKYFAVEAAQRAAKTAVDIHGGYGTLVEYAVTRYLRDAAVLGAAAGTSDIMKVVVARWVLS